MGLAALFCAGCIGDFFPDSATTGDATSGCATETDGGSTSGAAGTGAVGCAVESWVSAFESAGISTAERRGSASAATTSMTIATSAAACERVSRRATACCSGAVSAPAPTAGAELVSGRTGTSDGAFVSDVVVDGLVDILAFSFGRAAFDLRRFGCDRSAFFRAVVVRADFFLAASAETSSVKRTRRPSLGCGILMTRFDTMIYPDSGDARQFVYPQVSGPDDRIAKRDGYRTVRPLSNPFRGFLTSTRSGNESPGAIIVR
jgi:hypothetical protein